jgi:adenosylmethionine-8-amino-7-oxononanoate aminotransferase
MSSAQTSSHLWLHLTSLSNRSPLRLQSGKGCHVVDTDGKRYLDALAGNFCVQVGYGREELVSAAVEQMKTLAFCRNVGMTTDATVELADELSQLSGLSRVFFSSGGSEAVESAMKLARQYHQLQGAAGRTKFVSRDMAYHGATLGALSLNGVPSLRAPYEPLLPGCVRVPMPAYHESDTSDLASAKWIRRAIESEGPETVAAVIVEPVQVTGGPFVPPTDYFEDVRAICDEYGVLLISDEVVNAFGRLGGMFAYQALNFRPDIVTLAKGLTSGYMPAGATLVASHVAEPFESGTDYFRHILTYGGHPAASAVALANIRILQEEELAAAAVRTGKHLTEALSNSLEHTPFVGSIRGMGLLIGVELVDDLETHHGVSTTVAESVAAALMEFGLITRVDTRGHPIIQIAPPLICSDDEIDEIANGVDGAIRQAAGRSTP